MPATQDAIRLSMAELALLAGDAALHDELRAPGGTAA